MVKLSVEMEPTKLRLEKTAAITALLAAIVKTGAFLRGALLDIIVLKTPDLLKSIPVQTAPITATLAKPAVKRVQQATNAIELAPNL